MTGYQIISDLQRVVRIEAESAMPDRPLRPDTPRAPRPSIVTTLRLNMTLALRRLADAVEPARACLDAPAQPKGQRS
jgi:hypothetical protein